MIHFHVDQSSDAHCCVYKLTSPTGKIYIGCTGQKPKTRWNNGKGYSSNSTLYADIEKYGWDAFNKEILCEHLTPDGMAQIEKKMTEKLDAQNPEIGYNAFSGGKRKGSTLSEERKKYKQAVAAQYVAEHPQFTAKIRETCKKSRNTPEFKEAARQRTNQYIAKSGKYPFRKAIAVMCIETGEIFRSMYYAGKAVGVNHRAISYVCNGIKYTAGGYHWRFA